MWNWDYWHFFYHWCYFCSAAQSHPTLLRPHGLQYPRPLCPSPSPKFAQVHMHCISDAIQPSHPLMPSSPSASIFPWVRDFSNESAVYIRWLKYWSFNFSISPSKEYSSSIIKLISSIKMYSFLKVSLLFHLFNHRPWTFKKQNMSSCIFCHRFHMMLEVNQASLVAHIVKNKPAIQETQAGNIL